MKLATMPVSATDQTNGFRHGPGRVLVPLIVLFEESPRLTTGQVRHSCYNRIDGMLDGVQKAAIVSRLTVRSHLAVFPTYRIRGTSADRVFATEEETGVFASLTGKGGCVSRQVNKIAFAAKDLRHGSRSRRPRNATANSSFPLSGSHDRMNATRTMFAVASLVWLVSAVVTGAEDKGLSSRIQVTKYAPRNASFPGCTQIAFSGKTEIVTTGDRLFYRTESKSPFRESPINGLKDAHSVVFNPRDRLFYATDTGNHRLVTFREPASRQLQNRLTSLANTKLQRPHDIVLDQSTGWLYSLNPDSSHLFRFQTVGKKADSLDLSRHLGYSRALTIVNGRLYVVGSSVGSVVEIIDFAKQRYKIHNSFWEKEECCGRQLAVDRSRAKRRRLLQRLLVRPGRLRHTG